MLYLLSAWCLGAVALGGLLGASASAAEKEDHPQIFAEFRAWAERLLTASDADARAAVEKEGEALAAKRRAAMAQLIQSFPQRALELAVPNRLRGLLPAAVTRLLEQRLSGRGDLNVLVSDDFAQGKSEFHRTVTLHGRTYRAFVYGRRIDQPSQHNVPLHGIVLDDLMAVHESPGRVLEPDEPVAPQVPVGNPDLRCPVCRQPAAKDVAVEVAGKIYYLDRLEHVAEFDKQIK